MITIILLVLGGLIVIFALSFFFSWSFFAQRAITDHFEDIPSFDSNGSEGKIDNANTLKIVHGKPIFPSSTIQKEKFSSSNFIKLIPQINQLCTIATAQIDIHEEKGKGCYIAIGGRFEASCLSEHATEEKIKQSLYTELKQQQASSNFVFEEKSIDDLAYQIFYEINLGLGTHTKYENFLKEGINSDTSYKFQDVKVVLNCIPHFENNEKKWVDVEIIVQGVKAINFAHAKELFASLPEKFCDIPTNNSAMPKLFQ